MDGFGGFGCNPEIEIWDVAKKQLIRKITEKGRCYNVACVFVPGQPLLVAITSDNTLRIWDFDGSIKKELKPITWPNYKGLLMSQDGQNAFVAGTVQGKNRPEVELVLLETKTWTVLHRHRLPDWLGLRLEGWVNEQKGEFLCFGIRELPNRTTAYEMCVVSLAKKK